ncbi:MAG TPA: MFS transporter, partial [Myxococcota bacterium]|nr:MFS transporter [Myxococcota bacterium]
MTPLPRAVRLLGVTSLLTDLSGDMVAPLLPALLAGMGAGPRWLGVLEGTADTVSAIMRYVAGWMSDRTTRRLPWVIAGYGLTGLVRPAFALASSPIGLLGLRALDRVGKGVRTAPRDALLSTAPDRSRAFAFHRAMDHTGTLLGPLVASALLALGADARTVVLASIVPGVLAVIAASQVPEEPSDAPPAAKAAVVDRPAAPGWGAFLRAS